MQGITTTGGKHGMICGVNVFGVLFAARFISLLSLRELRYLECDCFVTWTLDSSASLEQQHLTVLFITIGICSLFESLPCLEVCP